MNLPKDPPPGLLMSMAIRYDHALGCEGYYDQELFGNKPGEHQRRLEATLRTMRQLYEEVSGYGFYKPELETQYAKLVPIKDQILALIETGPKDIEEIVVALDFKPVAVKTAALELANEGRAKLNDEWKLEKE